MVKHSYLSYFRFIYVWYMEEFKANIHLQSLASCCKWHMFFKIQTFVNLDETAHVFITFVFTIMLNVTSLLNWDTCTIPAGKTITWIALNNKILSIIFYII